MNKHTLERRQEGILHASKKKKYVAMEVTEPNELNNRNNSQLNVEELDFEILPVIYEIIRSVERDPHDNAAKARESQDCSQKVLELQKKLDQARAQIRRLPGIEFSREQQLQRLEALKTQLRLKQELLQKYRHMCSLDTLKA